MFPVLLELEQEADLGQAIKSIKSELKQRLDELNEWKSRFSTPEEILEDGRRNYDPRKLKIAVESARKVAIAIEKRENGR